jgi:hypothetical protein
MIFCTSAASPDFGCSKVKILVQRDNEIESVYYPSRLEYSGQFLCRSSYSSSRSLVTGLPISSLVYHLGHDGKIFLHIASIQGRSYQRVFHLPLILFGRKYPVAPILLAASRTADAHTTKGRNLSSMAVSSRQTVTNFSSQVHFVDSCFATVLISPFFHFSWHVANRFNEMKVTQQRDQPGT